MSSNRRRAARSENTTWVSGCSDPSSGTASSWSGFGVGGNDDDVVIAPRGSTYSQSFELAADRELELIGMLRPSSTVHLKVQDGSGADTGIELSVQLQPGRRTRAELPAPTVKRFVGQVVSLSNGARLDGATYKTSGWWPMLRETKVADSTLDLQLAANSELTLLHPTHLPRTWQEPEPDGLYRLEPARTLQLRVVDAAGTDVPVTDARCSDAQGREYSVGCSPTAAPSIERVPLGALTLRADERWGQPHVRRPGERPRVDRGMAVSGYPARIRTLTNRTRICCATVTPRGSGARLEPRPPTISAFSEREP